ncbi:MAG: hypothetical protein K0Q66_2093 [Chitinophagaceae bacterium]|nr:hypothetical protein [Chitinophagaceae bacterium]
MIAVVASGRDNIRMDTNERLVELQKQYEILRQQLIDAVGGSTPREELEQIKRRLETIASQIRKIDVNRKL